MLEYEAWAEWSNTPQAQVLGFTPDRLAAIVVNGHYFLPKDGTYSQIRQRVQSEFQTGEFVLTEKIIGLAQELSSQCVTMAHQLGAAVSFEDFIRAFDLMSRLRFPWMASFPIGDAGSKFVDEYSVEHHMRVDEVTELIPQVPNSVNVDQQQLSRFKLQIEKEQLPFEIEAIQAKNPSLAQEILRYQKETEYIGTHHFWGDERSLPRLMDAIKNASVSSEGESKEKNTVKAFEVIAQVTKWRLECAQSSAVLAYALRPFMVDLAKQHNLDYGDLIYLLTSEMRELINGKNDFLPIIRERQKAVGMFKVDGTMYMATGNELKDWEQHFGLLDTHDDVEQLTGAIGNRGKVQGIVAIVLKPSDQIKVKPGMILVAPETTPDFIPSMGKAIAFITDQGGITSHAAIVAREMKKPCIIGTKIATKVLKDGDLVEVDAEKGIVKILKRGV